MLFLPFIFHFITSFTSFCHCVILLKQILMWSFLLLLTFVLLCGASTYLLGPDRGPRRCCPWASRGPRATRCVDQRRWRLRPRSGPSPSPTPSTARSMLSTSWASLPPRWWLVHAGMVSGTLLPPAVPVDHCCLKFGILSVLFHDILLNSVSRPFVTDQNALNFFSHYFWRVILVQFSWAAALESWNAGLDLVVGFSGWVASLRLWDLDNWESPQMSSSFNLIEIHQRRWESVIPLSRCSVAFLQVVSCLESPLRLDSVQTALTIGTRSGATPLPS